MSLALKETIQECREGNGLQLPLQPPRPQLACSALFGHTNAGHSAGFSLLTVHIPVLNKYSKVREFICHLQQHNLIADKVVSLEGGLAKAEELLVYCCSGKTL